MPRAVRFENETVAAGGGTTTILSTSETEKIVLSTSGAIVMAGNYTLTHDGAWAEGSELDVLWTGSATLGAFNITLFGYALTQAQATAGNLEGTAYAKSGLVVFTPNLTTGSAQVGTADLADESVTVGKMADLARGSIIRGGVANRPEALAVGNAQIIIGNATDVVAVAQTGDGAYTNTGVFGITAGALVNADFSATAGVEVSKLEAMSDGEVITGNTGGGNIATIVPLSADVLIANTGATTVQAGVITPEKASGNLNTQTQVQYIDLADATTEWSVTMGDNFILTDIWINLDRAAGFNITLDLEINGTPVTGGQVSFTAADPPNTNNQGTAITANNTGSAGDVVAIVPTAVNAGETATGTVSLIYTKTS